MPIQESEKALFAALEIKDSSLRLETLNTAISALAHECDINCKNRFGKSALMISLECSDTQCTKLLLDAKANVDDRDIFGNTVLMSAIDNGEDECVKLLIDASADINAVSNKGYTALEIAMDKKAFQSIQWLLEKKVNIKNIHELIFLLFDQKKLEFLNLLLDIYQNQSYIERIFEGAALYGHKDIVKKLLAQVSLKAINHALNLAAQNNFIEIIHALFPLVSLAKEKLQELFFLAAKNGDLRFLTTLIESNVNVNGCNGFETALMFAAKNSHFSCVKKLLASKANVNQKTRNGTALMIVAKMRDAKCMQLLLENKASPDLLSSCHAYDFFTTEMTPLEYLAEYGDVACMSLLLEYKANLNHPKIGSVVTKAAKEGDVEMVKLLIDAKANLTKVNTDFPSSILDNFKRIKRQAECVSLIQDALGGVTTHEFISSSSRTHNNIR